MKENTTLIVYSRSNESTAKKIQKQYSNVDFLVVDKPPCNKEPKIKYNSVIAIGGGSVIDTAKLIAKPNKCTAIPTTASGSAVTPFATVWNKKKETVKTPIPKLNFRKDIDVNLPRKVIVSTFCDALSHSIESIWSLDKTILSKKYANEALKELTKYIKYQNIFTLIHAGNLAGKAIAINKTNLIHSISYPITINYNINHGIACGIIFYVLERMGLFSSIKSCNLSIYSYIKRNINNIYTPEVSKKLKKINCALIALEAIEYKKIFNSVFHVSIPTLMALLIEIKRGIQK